MKKVITTVGTSIFSNYRNENDDKKLNYNYLENNYSENNEDRNQKIIATINKWINNVSDESKISAEIKSLLKLKNQEKGDLEVYLITTDTVASNLAAEIIKSFFANNDKIMIAEIIKIKNLQVKDFKRFEKGEDNLIRTIADLMDSFVKDIKEEKQKKELRKNVIFNITGGYKGIIPLMTILAQLYECKIFYIFEESNDMISIPRIPINFDPILTESLYIDLWFLKENKSYNLTNEPELKEYKFIRFIDKKNIQITALGNVFYKMVHNHQAISNNVFGYFMEYKILKYLYLSGRNGFSHSFKSVGLDGIERELDFVFQQQNGNWEVWEVKSAKRFLNKQHLEKITKQLTAQLENYKEIKRYKLVVYSITDKIKPKLTNVLKNILNELKEEFCDINFEAEFLLLEGLQSIKNQDKKSNPYQILFTESLKENNFTKINLEEKDV